MNSSTSSSWSPLCHYHQHSHHCDHHSTHRHSKTRDTTTIPLPHKVQCTIERDEFIDFSDLLCYNLMKAGKSAKTHKATQARHNTNLDTWLEAWRLYATGLANAKPQLAPELLNTKLSLLERARDSGLMLGFSSMPS